MPERELTFAGPRGPLSALFRDADPPVAIGVGVVAHGAGNDMRNRFLDGVVAGLTGGSVSAMRFNFPFTQDGRRSPDRAPVLMEAWRAGLAGSASPAHGLPPGARRETPGGPMG